MVHTHDETSRLDVEPLPTSLKFAPSKAKSRRDFNDMAQEIVGGLWVQGVHGSSCDGLRILRGVLARVNSDAGASMGREESGAPARA
jgi:hypothetical protein